MNVTRTKVAQTREALRAEWHLPHRGSENNDGQFCAQAMRHGDGSIQFVGREGNVTDTQMANDTSSKPHHDHAHELWHMPELVLCSGTCVTEESRSPCPRGVPLQRNDGSTCECDEAFPLLRCREPGQAPREDPCPWPPRKGMTKQPT